MIARLLLIGLLLIGYGCSRPARDISFYYWKTNFRLTHADSTVLADNQVKKLYLRLFDVDRPDPKAPPQLLAVVRQNNSTGSRISLIPVIFVKNRVFTGADSTFSDELAKKLAARVNQITANWSKPAEEIQIDCDWTGSTRNAYFRFLQQLKRATGLPVSATIRLHQVKYPLQTGVPPVDKGMLMYYNMGHIADISERSIFDPQLAALYAGSIPSYPLPLDLALPIFSWGIQLRDGRVVGLLNKMTFSDFSSHPMFVKASEDRFRVVQAGFHGGYYFRENDVVKIESVSSEELKDIASGIRSNRRYPFEQLVFYDLDSINYARYEKSIFKEVGAALH